MVRTNKDKLVMISVVGEVSSPQMRYPYRITTEGEAVILPGTGGVTYNLRVGDIAVGLKADHVEPGVSSKNKEKDAVGDLANTAYNLMSCLGNEAILMSGEAKGEKGIVVGKHGGIEHVLVDYPFEVLEKIVPGDKILIKAYGMGLELIDYPNIKAFNLDPRMIDKLTLEEKDGKLGVGVTHIVPAQVMGSGLGAFQVQSGDYDITLFDKETVDRLGLEDIRFGDIIAIMDTDHSFGRIFYQGAVTIGVVTHSDCVLAGHGPGVTTIFTSKSGSLEPYINPKANLALLWDLRESI